MSPIAAPLRISAVPEDWACKAYGYLLALLDKNHGEFPGLQVERLFNS